MSADPSRLAAFSPHAEASAFEQRLGPYLVSAPDAAPALGLVVTEKTLNHVAVAQGGFMLALGASAMRLATRRTLGGGNARLAAYRHDFMRPVHAGDFAVAHVEELERRGALLHGRGHIETGHGTAQSFVAIVECLDGEAQRTPPLAMTVPSAFAPAANRGPYGELYGPVQRRKRADGRDEAGALLLAHHEGAPGLVHPGALLALADVTLDLGYRVREGPLVTLSLAAEFRADIPLGAFIEMKVASRRSTRTFEFVRGALTVDGRAMVTYEATMTAVARARLR